MEELSFPPPPSTKCFRLATENNYSQMDKCAFRKKRAAVLDRLAQVVAALALEGFLPPRQK